MSLVHNIHLSNVTMKSIILYTNKNMKTHRIHNTEGYTSALHKYRAILCQGLEYLQVIDRPRSSLLWKALGDFFFVRGCLKC